MQLTTRQSGIISSSAFLVTGGAGFIGSHLAEFLLNAGARKVTILDNLSTGHFRNVAPFANHLNFEFLIGDICDAAACKVACQGIDYVLHEAASGSVCEPVEEPGNRPSGFLNMLEAARDASVKRFVYAPGPLLFSNNGKQDPAAEKTALIHELYAEEFAKKYGLETIGLRYVNVFGKRQNFQNGYAAVIPELAMRLIRHESPVIRSAHEHLQDFTYVENIVQANMLALLTTNPEAVNQVYPIAFKEKASLFQVAGYLKEIFCAFDVSIGGTTIQEPGQEEMVYTDTYSDKAKNLLGYDPCYSLQNGLLKSAGWYWTYLPQFIAETKQQKPAMRNEE